jgi:Major tropism determinant N-terminal domain
MAVITQIQFRRGTAAQWSSTNPILSSGELGYETDTGNFKIGNGSTAWNSLSVLNGITASTTATFTNKTINLASNTLTGTIAEFNTALSDGDFATLAGTETLTNKTLTTPVITLSGTSSTTQGRIAWDQTNKQIDIGDGTVTRTFTADDAAATLTNKTISGASNTLSNIGNSSLTNSSVTVNGTAISLGASGTVTVPVSTGVTGLGTGVATFLATPSSANLASAVTDETGSGSLVFGTSPTIGGTLTASGQINMTATNAVGNVQDFQALQIMDCI